MMALQALPRSPVVDKDQQEPHWPQFSTRVTTPCAVQSTEAGKTIPLCSTMPLRGSSFCTAGLDFSNPTKLQCHLGDRSASAHSYASPSVATTPRRHLVHLTELQKASQLSFSQQRTDRGRRHSATKTRARPDRLTQNHQRDPAHQKSHHFSSKLRGDLSHGRAILGDQPAGCVGLVGPQQHSPRQRHRRVSVVSLAAAAAVAVVVVFAVAVAFAGKCSPMCSVFALPCLDCLFLCFLPHVPSPSASSA